MVASYDIPLCILLKKWNPPPPNHLKPPQNPLFFVRFSRLDNFLTLWASEFKFGMVAYYDVPLCILLKKWNPNQLKDWHGDLVACAQMKRPFRRRLHFWIFGENSHRVTDRRIDRPAERHRDLYSRHRSIKTVYVLCVIWYFRFRTKLVWNSVKSTLRAPSKRRDAVMEEQTCARRRFRLVYVGRSISRLRLVGGSG